MPFPAFRLGFEVAKRLRGPRDDGEKAVLPGREGGGRTFPGESAVGVGS